MRSHSRTLSHSDREMQELIIVSMGQTNLFLYQEWKEAVLVYMEAIKIFLQSNQMRIVISVLTMKDSFLFLQ